MQYFFSCLPGTAGLPSRGGRSRSGEHLACRGDRCSVPVIPPVVDTMFSCFPHLDKEKGGGMAITFEEALASVLPLVRPRDMRDGLLPDAVGEVRALDVS